MVSSPKHRAHEGVPGPKLSDEESHSDVFERPTLAPPFDVQEFARVKMAQSDERLSLPDAPTLSPPSSGTHERAAVITLDEEALVERLGSLTRVATLTVSPTELRALPVDHRGAFLLSQVDGVSTLDMILDVSGMSRVDALRILIGFAELGIISLD